MVDSTTIQNWYNSTTTDVFLNDALVLMEVIFIRDGSFDISENSVPRFSIL